MAFDTMDAQEIFVSGDAVVAYTDALLPFDELPDTVDEALPTGAKGLGLTSDDGEELERTVETETIDAHQLIAARIIVTNGTFTLSVTALESNPNVEELYFAVGGSATSAVRIKQGKAKYVTVFYDTMDTDEGYEKKIRTSFQALVTPNGSLPNSRTGATGYALLFTAQGYVKRTIIAGA